MRSSTGGGATFILAAAVLWGTTGAAATLAPDATALTIGATAMGIGGLLQAGFAGRLVRRHRVALAGQWRLAGDGHRSGRGPRPRVLARA